MRSLLCIEKFIWAVLDLDLYLHLHIHLHDIDKLLLFWLSLVFLFFVKVVVFWYLGVVKVPVEVRVEVVVGTWYLLRVVLLLRLGLSKKLVEEVLCVELLDFRLEGVEDYVSEDATFGLPTYESFRIIIYPYHQFHSINRILPIKPMIIPNKNLLHLTPIILAQASIAFKFDFVIAYVIIKILLIFNNFRRGHLPFTKFLHPWVLREEFSIFYDWST